MTNQGSELLKRWKFRGVVIFVGLAISCDVTGYEVERSIPYKVLKDSQELLADVYIPDKVEGPLPTLLMIHGGAWFSGNKVHVAYHATHAAEHGFAVVAINYRLAPRHKFPAQLDDCRDALAWIAENDQKYGFDKSRVAVYGYSAGAHLASLVGMMQNDSKTAKHQVPTVRAVVAGGTPTEFSWIPEDAKTLAYWLGDSRSNMPSIYKTASPLEYVDKGDPPTYLFHGKSDRIVPIQSAKKMADALKISNVPYQLHIIENATHIGAFLNREARLEATMFLQKHLNLSSTQ